MTALVTGGAGFIGSSIARALLTEGFEVRILDNLSTGFEENIPAGAEMIRGDLRDADAVMRACQGVEVVFHQAAFKNVLKSIEDPLLSESCNAAGTLNLLMAAEKAEVRRLIYASSSSAYGEAAELVKHEEMPTNPLSPYGVSKLAGEQYCRVWTKVKGFPTVCLRYFNVFGPGQHPASKYSAVFPAFISALTRSQPPVIYGDGEQSRDFTFIGDVVRANLMASSADDSVDGTLMNICAGAPRTVNQVYESIAQALGTRIPPRYEAERPGEIRHSYGDTSRARSMLGWAPEADWDEAVKQTVDWFVSRGDRAVTPALL